MGGLDCIAGLSSKDSLDNSTFVGRRELGGVATMVIFFVWLDFLKDPSPVDFPIPVWDAMFQQERLREAREMILFF